MGPMLPAIGQTAVDSITSSGRSRRFLGLFMRRCILAVDDPIVRFRYHNADLSVPLSHNLPLIHSSISTYARNLADVVNAATTEDQHLVVVDVGANVGDSVAVVPASRSRSWICVEAAGQYFDLLEHNVRERDDVVVLHGFVGDESKTHRVAVADGTGAVSSEGEPVATISLETAIQFGIDELCYRQRILNSDIRLLVKVDTDGHDADVLVACADTLINRRPDVFFEFDPILTDQRSKADLMVVADLLLEAGYDHFVAWDKYGVQLSEFAGKGAGVMFPLLDRYCRTTSERGRGSTFYLDVHASTEARS